MNYNVTSNYFDFQTSNISWVITTAGIVWAGLILGNIFKRCCCFQQPPNYESSVLNKLYSLLKTSNSFIDDGYGEYLIFDPTKELSCQDFEKIFSSSFFHTSFTGSESRRDFIREKVKKINSNLDIIFIPRTLYDLFYVKAAIEEEKEKGCELLGRESFLQYKEDKLQKNPKCWHTIWSKDKHTPLTDRNLQGLAYRLNQYILNSLHQKNQSLTGKEITQYLEEIVTFLKDHSQTFAKTFYSNAYKGSRHIHGPAIHFGMKNTGGICFTSMNISNEKEAQLLRNAVALECDKIAKNSLILYRAGSFFYDMESRSPLSYGVSLLAGCVRDPGACVLFHSLNGQRDAYAILIPRNELLNSPFYVPFHSTIDGLLAEGEIFHSRRKTAKKDTQNWKQSIHFVKENKIPEELSTDQSSERIISLANTYHKNAHLLFSSKPSFS